jgi:hypothetical protein
MQGKGMSQGIGIGIFICVGLIGLGYFLGTSALKFKSFERSVTVKGLSEREVPADIALWPITMTATGNDLAALHAKLAGDTERMLLFLKKHGLDRSEVSVNAPAITDKLAREYGGQNNVRFRYVAARTLNVYSTKVDLVRATMSDLGELLGEGIIFRGQEYGNTPQYLFTGLNDIKPSMVEEATRNAREVARKFAQDSNSALGKIKRARQGQFSITPRDAHTPYIKKVRVVSTVEYYLSD